MVGKTYLRYVPGPQGGAIVSNEALTVAAALGRGTYNQNVNFNNRGVYGRGRAGGGRPLNPGHPQALSTLLFLPAIEAVRVYSIKSGVVLHTLIPAELKMPVEVAALHVVPLSLGEKQNLPRASSSSCVLRDGWMLFVGYTNGYVSIFSCTPSNNYGKPVCLLYALGHRIDTKVLALTAEGHGGAQTVLCSAGQDTDITVWDLVSMEASFRLRGHRGGITGMAFVPTRRSVGAVSSTTTASSAAGGFTGLITTDNELHSGVGVQVLVTVGADGWLKVWDLNLRQCLQTLVVCDSQVTSLFMDFSGARLYCGMRENVIKVYHMEALTNAVNGAIQEETKRISDPTRIARATAALENGIVPHGELQRRHHKPITFMASSPDGTYLLATTSSSLEVFRMNTGEEVKKKLQRKKKRKQRREAKHPSGQEGDDEDEGEPASQRQRVEENLEVSKFSHVDSEAPKEPEGLAGDAVVRSATEEVTLLRTFFLPQKIRSACFIPSTTLGNDTGSEGEELHIAVTFRNNDVQTYTTTLITSDVEGAAVFRLSDLKQKFSLTAQGHQSDVRRLCFVDTDSALVSMSSEKLILWTVSIRLGHMGEEDFAASTPEAHHDFYDDKEANLKKVEAEGSLTPAGQLALDNATAMDALHSALCCVGQADGGLVLADVAASTVLFTEPAAHVGGVKHLRKNHEKTGFLTVGEDRRLLSWIIGVSAAEEDAKDNESVEKRKAQQPTLLLSHEVELAELPLFIECSSDGRFIGVGLQNNHIQLFFADRLKPYLSLFGHKLPPTAMSFSTDGALVASVGMDKSLRFWGTDFGDCHRAIHAHDEYVTDVVFLHDTHYAFTVSMDSTVKQWDGDRFHMIQMFRQHSRGLWALAATLNGTCVVAAGSDKSLRCFLRTASIVFPEEEEERMAHEAMEEETMRREAKSRLDAVTTESSEVGVAGHATTTTAEAAEKLMSALDLVSVEQQRQQNPDDTSPRHPLLANKSEWEYLWSILQSIRTTDVRHAVHGLTSLHVDALLDDLVFMIDAGVVTNYEIAARFLLAVVMPAPGLNKSTSAVFRSVALAGDAAGASPQTGLMRLEGLRRRIASGLDETVMRFDYSMAGLQAVRQELEEREKLRFFDLSKIQGYKKKYHSSAL